MAFPQTPLDLHCELFYSGAWNDVTSDVRGMTAPDGRVNIRRGVPDEGGSLHASTCRLAFNNRDGRYSLSNPLSPLYGLIGRNTPLRVSIGTPHVGEAITEATDSTSQVAPSVDAPTDDGLLICAWANPDPSNAYTLPGGMSTGPTTSDPLTTMAAAHQVISAAGATGTRTATVGTLEDYAAASVVLHGESVGVALTGGFSVVLGNIAAQAGRWWVVVSYFGWDDDTLLPPDYPSDTDGGGWMLLSDSGTDAWGDPQAANARMKVWTKRVKTTGTHTIKVRNTVAAPGNDGIQSVFYEVSGVADFSYRFHGEVAQWPPRWDKTGRDVWTPIEAAGITRRAGRVATSLRSALFRAYNDVTPQGYWPLEDLGDDTQSVPPGIPRTGTGQSDNLRYSAFNASTRWSADTTLSGASSLPVMTLGEGVGAVNLRSGYLRPRPAAGDTSWSFAVWNRTTLLEDQTGTSTISTQVEVVDSDDIERWTFMLRQTNGSGVAVHLDAFAVSPAGVVVSDVSLPSILVEGYEDRWRFMRVTVDLVGADHRLRVWLDEDLLATVTDSPVDFGRPVRVSHIQVQLTNSSIPTSVGHIAIASGAAGDPISGNAAVLFAAGSGHAGEKPSERFIRLCTEEVITHAVVGDPDGEEVLLGPQRPGKLLDIFKETAQTGGGHLYEPREFRGYVYRAPGSTYNRSPVLELDYSAGVLGSVPDVTEDTRFLINDVTVTRRDGGSVRRVQETGPLNVQDPADDPDGVGRYDTSVAANVLGDGFLLEGQAGWQLHQGTVADPRWVGLHLHQTNDAWSDALRTSARALDVGDRWTLENPLGTVGAPDDVTQLARGFREVLSQYESDVFISSVPESPNHIAEVEHELYGVIGSDGTVRTLGEVTTTSTSINFTIENGYTWTDEAFPLDAMLGGERITLTAVTGPAATQTFTVVRSVNGVVKTHPTGTRLDVFHKSYIGL